jgi:hypothetical protein
VDGHAGVLQQRVQVPPIGRHRQQAGERIGQKQDQTEKAHAQRRLNGDRDRQSIRQPAPAKRDERRRPRHQNDVPQVQRALVSAPRGADLVHQRQRAIRVLRHVPHGKIVGHESVHQRQPADQREPELQPRAAHGDAGEFRPAQQPRQQRRQRLQHGDRQRQHDREVTDFDQVLARRHQNGFPGFRRGGG